MRAGGLKKRRGPAKIGERRQWADGKQHVRTPDGWKVAVEKAKAKAVGIVNKAAKNARHEEKYRTIADEGRKELRDLAKRAGSADRRMPSRSEREHLRNLLNQQRDVRYDLKISTEAADKYRGKKEAALKKIRVKAGAFKKQRTSVPYEDTVKPIMGARHAVKAAAEILRRKKKKKSPPAQPIHWRS